MAACGWPRGVMALQDTQKSYEEKFQFERSAAIAVWCEQLDDAVSALQRASETVRATVESNDVRFEGMNYSSRYAETLDLVAMNISGMSDSSLWKRSCKILLKRIDDVDSSDGDGNPCAPYLRAICNFLLNSLKKENHLIFQTLDDVDLAISDRIAIASKFLDRKSLQQYLEGLLGSCEIEGNLEGIIITGLNRKGVDLMQSYVDSSADIQTAAFVTSRVLPPREWGLRERELCAGWLHTYRNLLNTWQMWTSRAMFDVERLALQRELKTKRSAQDSMMRGSRRPQPSHRPQQPQHTPRQESDFGPQIHARCTYCNQSLSCSQKPGQGAWLQNKNPVINCCPNISCKKELPRCAVCMLQMGCLNPSPKFYQASREAGRGAIPSLNPAVWFTWCMRCKHGGHAHHMVGWFEKHMTCPVPGCDCHCEFDAIKTEIRPWSKTNTEETERNDES